MSSIPNPVLENIQNNGPTCIRERRQWVAWKYIERDGKPTKAPINPHNGSLAASTDAATWGSFIEAVEACRQDSNLAGVGFVFTPNDPYCGVDLDDSIDPESGQLKPWAAQFVALLDSYTEVSPSGTGVKVFLKANKVASLTCSSSALTARSRSSTAFVRSLCASARLFCNRCSA